MYWHSSNDYSMRQIIQPSKIIWGEFSSLLRNAMLYCRGAAKGNSLLPEIEIRRAVKFIYVVANVQIQLMYTLAS